VFHKYCLLDACFCRENPLIITKGTCTAGDFVALYRSLHINSSTFPTSISNFSVSLTIKLFVLTLSLKSLWFENSDKEHEQSEKLSGRRCAIPNSPYSTL